jgi:hypothetical protein
MCETLTKRVETSVSALKKKLAATYSRGVYKTTTIGKTVFDGRVRNGNGSGHSFRATKKRVSGCGSIARLLDAARHNHRPLRNSKSKPGHRGEAVL